MDSPIQPRQELWLFVPPEMAETVIIACRCPHTQVAERIPSALVLTRHPLWIAWCDWICVLWHDTRTCACSTYIGQDREWCDAVRARGEPREGKGNDDHPTE